MISDYFTNTQITLKHLNKIKQLTNLDINWKTTKQLNILLDVVFSP